MSEGIALLTQNLPLQLGFSADNTGANFTAPVPLTTTPAAGTGIALITLGSLPATLGAPPPVSTFNNLLLAFFGVGTSGNTFTAYVIGWKPVILGGTLVAWWPFPLCELTVTLGAGQCPVAACFPSGNSDLIAHQISVVIGNANVDVTYISPGSNIPAWALVDAKGCPLVTVQLTMGTATKGNFLACSV